MAQKSSTPFLEMAAQNMPKLQFIGSLMASFGVCYGTPRTEIDV